MSKIYQEGDTFQPKVGMKVKLYYSSGDIWCKEGKITGIEESGNFSLQGRHENWEVDNTWYIYCRPLEYKIEVLSDSLISNSKTMSLLDKAKLLFTTEPKKSYLKTGIMNDDGLISDNGEKIFLTWLLKENEEKFMEDIVKPLLEEEKK